MSFIVGKCEFNETSTVSVQIRKFPLIAFVQAGIYEQKLHVCIFNFQIPMAHWLDICILSSHEAHLII